jgi:hypothetical protein
MAKLLRKEFDMHIISESLMLIALIGLLLGACEGDSDSNEDAGSDSHTDTDIDTDTDTDTDMDTDTDTDTDAGAGAGAGCTGTGVWYDPDNNLCWQDPPSATAMNWHVAAGVYHVDNNSEGFSYCSALGSGWRLPTISELRSLVRKGDDAECYTIEWNMAWPQAEAGYCRVSDSCLTYDPCYETSKCNPPACGPLMGPGVIGCYWHPALGGLCDHLFWSFSVYNAESSFIVSFDDGYVLNRPKSNTEYVRCVR